MIPEGAVKAAAEIISEVDYPNYKPDNALAARVLQAAAPYIAAQALREAADAFEDLPIERDKTISSGTWDWFDLFPIEHMRWRADEIEEASDGN